jgi:hypothetical protein
LWRNSGCCYDKGSHHNRWCKRSHYLSGHVATHVRGDG